MGRHPAEWGATSQYRLVATAAWKPNRVINLSIFAGMEFSGKLKLKNALDEVVGESDYDPAAIFGGTFVFRF